jgi:hypothetical protein
MSTTKQRDAGKERFWRGLFQQRLGSKLSVREFCLEQGVSEASFYAWRRILKQRDREGVRLVPVQVIAEEKRVGASAATGLELVLGNGRLLRIPPGFDEATLCRLLPLLEEDRP